MSDTDHPPGLVAVPATVRSSDGVHPGLWSRLVQKVRGLDAELTVRVEGHEASTADGTSFVYQVPTMVQRTPGQEVELAAEGPDAEEAVEKAADYLENSVHPHCAGGISALRRTYRRYDLPELLERVHEESRADQETREKLRFFVGYLRIAAERLEDDLQLADLDPRHPKLGEPAIPKLSTSYSREQGEKFYR